MIDKDLKDDAAITEAFPHALILYCFWHVEKIFQRKYKSTETLKVLRAMMLATSIEKFDLKKADFAELEKVDHMNNKIGTTV